MEEGREEGEGGGGYRREGRDGERKGRGKKEEVGIERDGEMEKEGEEGKRGKEEVGIERRGDGGRKGRGGRRRWV